MKIGYCRVSTKDQSLDGQRDALIAAGCKKVFEETASGAKADRAVLKQALEFAREGDVLVCVKLDRIARSLPHLVQLVGDLDARKVGLKSLTEEIDTSTSGGRLVFHIFGAIAEFERDLIRERTRAGLDAARKRGRVGGRPRAMTPAKLASARRLSEAGTPVRDIAESLGVSVPTIYRHLAAAE